MTKPPLARGQSRMVMATTSPKADIAKDSTRSHPVHGLVAGFFRVQPGSYPGWTAQSGDGQPPSGLGSRATHVRNAHKLPSWAHDHCRLEHTRDRHVHALRAVALACVNHNVDPATYRGLAMDLARAAAREDHKASALKALEYAWKQASARASSHPAKPDLHRIRAAHQAIEAEANATPWSGQAGNGDRCVLAGILAMAVERQTLLLALAVRDVAAASGVAKSTAARALKRLQTAGWLELVEQARDDRAARYLLTTPATDKGGTPSLPTGEEPLSHLRTITLQSVITHDAFASGALGRSAARVLVALPLMRGTSAHDIAEQLGLSTRTVRSALERLEAVGLAYQGPTGWIGRPDDADFDEIARAYGTDGLLERRKLQHTQERQGYADALVWIREKREQWRRGSRETRIRAAMHKHGLIAA